MILIKMYSNHKQVPDCEPTLVCFLPLFPGRLRRQPRPRNPVTVCGRRRRDEITTAVETKDNSWREKKSQAENDRVDFLLVGDVQAVTQTSETTPVQMKTEQQLELNQQLSRDVNDYRGLGYSQTEDVFLFGSI